MAVTYRMVADVMVLLAERHARTDFPLARMFVGARFQFIPGLRQRLKRDDSAPVSSVDQVVGEATVVGSNVNHGVDRTVFESPREP